MTDKKEFECVECGYQSPILYGKCPQCDNWNSMVKISTYEMNSNKTGQAENSDSAKSLENIDSKELSRYKSGISEFDSALGSGIVKGSVILIGGEPGVGKSTLLLEIAGHLSKTDNRILYFSGEESSIQIKSRAERLGINSSNIYLLTMGKLEDVKRDLDKIDPAFLIIDSIQTIDSNNSLGIAGSIQKLKFVTNELREIAKKRNITVFIIGHITKDGQLAGPKILEHIVDTVLYFQGDIQSDIRILRVEKNRFGSVNELGIFKMTEKGLTSVKNPSEVFLPDHKSLNPGTSIISSLKGRRSILIEVQALVSENPFGGNPRRVAVGFDLFRLSMLIAVIEKKMRLPFYKSDIFLNVTGGINIKETAGDLAICSALITSLKNITLPQDIILIGEIGLTGEIRPVQLIENRINESLRHGFKKFILPPNKLKMKNKDISFFPVKNLNEFYSLIKNLSASK